MGGPQPFRQGAGGHGARPAPQSSHPACRAPLPGSCWARLGSVCLNARGTPSGSPVSPARTGLGSGGQGLHTRVQSGLWQVPREGQGTVWPSSLVPCHPRASLLRAQTSSQALAWCPIPAGYVLQPLTFAALHVVSSEVEEGGPRESGGRSLRPQVTMGRATAEAPTAQDHHLSALRPSAPGCLLSPVCACGFPPPRKPRSPLPSCSLLSYSHCCQPPP